MSVKEKLVPAFDAALGLPMKPGEPALVPEGQLSKLNAEIKGEHADALRYHQEAAQVASLFAKRAIRPDEIAALRRRMFELVSKGLGEVDQVVMGTKNWSPTQTRLFAILVERVMPKLSNITVEDNTSKKLDELSLEELEAIALGKKKAGAVDAVVREAISLDEAADKHERRETKATVIRELAHVDAVSKAEREYIARQVSKPLAEIAEESAAQAVKPQPKFTDEQLENVRAARKVGLKERWREQGLPEEEIEARWQARLDKIATTKAQLRAERMTRLAVRQGLDPDAEEVAKAIRRQRDKTLREFRVPGYKGVRSQTSLTKAAQRRAEREQREQERELNPRIYCRRPIEGVPQEELATLTLQRLRELRPDLFERGDDFILDLVELAD